MFQNVNMATTFASPVDLFFKIWEGWNIAHKSIILTKKFKFLYNSGTLRLRSLTVYCQNTKVEKVSEGEHLQVSNREANQLTIAVELNSLRKYEWYHLGNP